MSCLSVIDMLVPCVKIVPIFMVLFPEIVSKAELKKLKDCDGNKTY